jgi:hypothetical protein
MVLSVIPTVETTTKRIEMEETTWRQTKEGKVFSFFRHKKFLYVFKIIVNYILRYEVHFLISCIIRRTFYHESVCVRLVASNVTSSSQARNRFLFASVTNVCMKITVCEYKIQNM